MSKRNHKQNRWTQGSYLPPVALTPEQRIAEANRKREWQIKLDKINAARQNAIRLANEDLGRCADAEWLRDNRFRSEAGARGYITDCLDVLGREEAKTYVEAQRLVSMTRTLTAAL